MTQNETELMTITSTNRTSNASTVSMKAAALNASTSLANAKQISSVQEDRTQSDQMEKIDGRFKIVLLQYGNWQIHNTLASLACLTTTASNALNISEKLQGLIDKLLLQNV